MAFGLVFAIAWTTSTVRNYRVPQNPEDICGIFDERRDWYRAAKRSEERWGTPTHIQMAIIRQESSFRFNARPPRKKLLGFIPWARPSNAYGYAQALDSTWLRYKNETGHQSADRDDFDKAIDFVGWYTDLSNRSQGISKWDAYNQYLAYHEGQSGFHRGSYNQKIWLKKTAKHVDVRARKWWAQMQGCDEDLNDRWWRFRL